MCQPWTHNTGMTAPTPSPRQSDPVIDDPMDLLLACHGKVRHFCQLLERLSRHVLQHGSDDQARDAAIAIGRYFTIAAPLHHEDEDLDLYPALAQMDASLADVAQALSQEHAALNAQWAQVSAWLDGGSLALRCSGDIRPGEGCVLSVESGAARTPARGRGPPGGAAFR